MEPSARPLVLWVAKRPLIEWAGVEHAVVEQAAAWTERAPDLVIQDTTLESAAKIALEPPWHDRPWLLWAPGADEASIRGWINRGRVDRILDGRSLDELEASARELLERSLDEKKRRESLGDFSRRTRELETLTQVLEKEVAERTGHLEASTIEEREKLGRERQLVRFLSEVSAHDSIEELLRSLRRELRRFHRLQAITLVWLPPMGPAESYSFDGGRWRKNELSVLGERLPEDESELRHFFANHFGRPFHRVLFFPLETRWSGRALFAFEYTLMDDPDLAELREVLEERRRALAMALEKIFLEERLRRSIWRWERTFDAFQDPVAVIDPEWNVLRGNSAFSRNWRGRRCFEVFAQRESPCESCPLQDGEEARFSSDSLSSEIRAGDRLYRLSSWPVRETGSERVSARVHHYVDITESRELYVRLLQNEKMSAIGELAGHIAHELNNPLTGIRALAQALLGDENEAAHRDDLLQIENAARRCQNIIRHLLDFASGGEGDPVPISLDEVVGGTLPLLKTPLRQHRHQMDLRTHNARVLADPHLLQQVVFNLVHNSCQAMKTPGAIEVSTAMDGPDHVRLMVADTGPGVPAELQGRLFEAFFTTKKEGEGTGLGLSTCKALVERFGGRISFRNREQGGAEFMVTFPIHRGRNA